MKHAVAIVACVALASCNKGPEVHEKNASVEEVANAVASSGVAQDIFLHAGEWKVVGTVEAMNIPNMPPEMQSRMKQAMSQHGKMGYQYCLTPEQAKKPGARFFSRQASKNCRYDHFTMADGKIDAVMRCAAPEGSTEMAITGTYGEDSYSTQVSMNMVGGREGGMSMKMRSKAQRIGECSPEDKAKAEKEQGTNG
jgi:hypothetical protein